MLASVSRARDSVVNFFKELDKRIQVLLVFIGMHTANQQLTSQYNQLYAVSLGANPIELGTLTSIGRIAGSLISIPSGWIADRYGPKTVILIGLALMAALAGFYSFAGTWFMLIPALLLTGAGTRLIMPFADIFFINLTKLDQRATIMSFSRTIWAIPRIFMPMVAAIIVTRFGGITTEGIRPLYYFSLVLAIIVFAAIALWLKSPTDNSVLNKKVQAEKGRSFTQDFRDLFKGEKWLTRWLIVVAIRNIGMNAAAPFVMLWIVNVKGADPYILGVMGFLSMIAFTVFQIPAGKLAEKIGRKKTFFLFRSITYISAFLLILAPNPYFLILMAVLGGTVFAGGGGGAGLAGAGQVAFITMEHELVPANKRGRWQGILGLFQLISFPASILGGYLWQQGFMMEVLLLPILMEVFIALPILNTIPDTLNTSKE